MSVDWHEDRYIESEADESFANRLRQAFRRGWSKSGGKGKHDLDDEALTLEGALHEDLNPRSRWLPIALTLVALIAFATVIWYAYNWGKGSLDSSALPVIARDSGPIKVRPADEGGVEIPDQDKLIFDGSLETAESGRVEHLLPAPEEPVDLSIVAAKEAGVTVQGLGHQLEASKPASPVVTVEEILPSGTSSQAAQSQDVIAQAIESDAAPGSATSSDSTSASSASSGGASAPETGAAGTAASNNAPAPAPAPAKPVAVQTAQVPTDSGYLLQLAAMQDPNAAKQEWARLQKAYPQLLGSLSLTVEKADVNGKIYYRILTGPFPTRETVEDICSQLKAKKQSCLVKKQAS